MFKLKLKLSAFAMSYLSSGERVREIVEAQPTKHSTNLNFVTVSGIKVAAVSLPLKHYRNIPDYVSVINERIAQAVQAGAQLIAFPELCGMLPLTMAPGFGGIYNDITHLEASDDNYRQAFMAVCEAGLGFCGEIYLNTFSRLAQAYGVMIASGSIFCWEEGSIKNRSFLFDEKGRVVGSQDKLFLSPIERLLGVASGGEIHVIKTKLGGIGLFTVDDLKNFEPFVIGSALGLDIAVAAASITDLDFSMARYRASESNSCIVVPTYCEGGEFGRSFVHPAAIYAPLSSTRSKDGVICRAEPCEAAIARVDVTKIKSSFDVYTADKNTDFYRQNYVLCKG